MVRKLQAVYESGILRPVQPLKLDEHPLVSVILFDETTDDEELRFEAPERFESLTDRSISLDAVRRALARIPGSLDSDFVAERNER